MTIVPVWRANIGGSDQIALDTLYSSDSNHASDAAYIAANRTTVNGVPVATNWGVSRWRFFLDSQHREKGLIWQMLIATAGAVNGIPCPARAYKGRTVYGLDLMGGELRIRVALDSSRKFYLAQKMQMLLLHQATDDRGYFGFPQTYVSVFMPHNRPTLDQALGAIPVQQRDASGYVILPTGQFVDYVMPFDPAEQVDMLAERYRMFPSGVYGRTGDTLEERSNMFERTRLQNVMVILHCPDAGMVLSEFGLASVVPPQYQPPDNWNTPGTGGLFYVASVELLVNPERNPNAIDLDA